MTKSPTVITEDLIESERGGAVALNRIISLSDIIARRDFATNMSMFVGTILTAGAYGLSIQFPSISFIATGSLALAIGLPGGALLAEFTPIGRRAREEARRTRDLAQIQDALSRKTNKLPPNLINELQTREVDILLRRIESIRSISIDRRKSDDDKGSP